jgi:hypothetical protein
MATKQTSSNEDKEKWSFFGDIDREGNRPDGDIRNPLPAWYYDNHIKELEESIAKRERQIKLGALPPESVLMMKDEIRKDREILVGITNSKLKLTDVRRNRLWDLYKYLSGALSDLLPTRTDMMKGLVNPHEELAKMKEPCINIEKYKGLMKAMNIKFYKNKISRDDASRAWKIAGKYLGEPTNTETLRRDSAYGTFKSEKSLQEMETDYNPVSPLTQGV